VVQSDLGGFAFPTDVVTTASHVSSVTLPENHLIG